MSFDRIAPHYGWLEGLFAGRALQRCRTNFLSELECPGDVLVLGEGNGRFLSAFLRAHPHSRVICVDGSLEMIRLAKVRLAKNGFGEGCRVSFVHQDIADWEAPVGCFDLIVVHFFFDCFELGELKSIVSKMKLAASSGAVLLLSDFHEPKGWLSGGVSRVLMWGLYCFFRFTAGVRAKKMVSPCDFLEGAGFKLEEERLSVFGLLSAQKWSGK